MPKGEIIIKELPMKPVYRLLTISLIPLLFLYFWISGVGPVYAAMPDEKVTTFAPVTAEPQPVETAQPPRKGISKWWYAALLAAVAGGATAAGGGKKDSGGGGTSTGSGTITW